MFKFISEMRSDFSGYPIFVIKNRSILEEKLEESLKKESFHLSSIKIILEDNNDLFYIRGIGSEAGRPSITYKRHFPSMYTGITSEDEGENLVKKISLSLKTDIKLDGPTAPSLIHDTQKTHEIYIKTFRLGSKERYQRIEECGINERISMIFKDGEAIEIYKDNNSRVSDYQLYVIFNSEYAAFKIQEAFKTSKYIRIGQLKDFKEVWNYRLIKGKIIYEWDDYIRFIKIMVHYWALETLDKK